MQFNKPKTGLQHLFYWPFLSLGVFFIYLDFELIYNFLFRQRSDDTFVYTGGMLVLVSLFSWGFFMIAAAVVRPKKSAQALLNEDERVKKKKHGIFYGIEFILSSNSLKLGEKFSVSLKGLNNPLLREKPLVLLFYCEESVGYASGAWGGYTATNYAHMQRHPLTHENRSGGKIELMIPSNTPPTYLELPNLTTEWYFRVEFLEPDRDIYYYNAGITSQELKVIPKLVEEAFFKTPKSTLQKVSLEEKWIELDNEPTEINSPLMVEVGGKVSGKLVILDRTLQTNAKKLSIELCFCLLNDEHRWTVENKYQVRIPDLAIGERFEHSFEFFIPEKGPISVAGGIFEINWSIRSRTFSEWLFGIESGLSSPFNVVPKGFVQKADNGE